MISFQVTKEFVLTPSDAVMIECRLGMESALSIFTMT